MKRLLVSAFMAAVLISGVNVSADDAASAPASTSVLSGVRARGSNLVNRVSSLIPTVNFAASRQWAVNNKWSVGGSAAVLTGVALMYKTCSWFRKLIGSEDEETGRRRVLDSRVSRRRA